MITARMPASPASGALTLLFLIAALAIGSLAFMVYPQVTYPIRADAVLANMSTDREVTWATLQIAEEAPEDDLLVIEVRAWASGAIDDGKDRSVEVVVLVPVLTANSVACEGDQECAVDVFTAPYANTYRKNRVRTELTWEPNRESATSENGDLSVLLRLEVRNYAPVNCTSYACRGSVPRVFVDPETSVSADAAAAVSVVIPGLASMRWDSDFLPGDRASPYLKFTTPLEASTELAYQTRYPFDGDSESAHDDADRRLFLAGALVGTAGGAILAAAQEGVPWLLQRRSPSNLPTPGNATSVSTKAKKRRR